MTKTTSDLDPAASSAASGKSEGASAASSSASVSSTPGVSSASDKPVAPVQVTTKTVPPADPPAVVAGTAPVVTPPVGANVPPAAETVPAVDKSFATDKPFSADKSVVIDKPLVTDKSGVTDKALAAGQASSSSQTLGGDKLSSAGKSSSTEKVSSLEKPFSLDRSNSIEKPFSAEKPLSGDKPLGGEKVLGADKSPASGASTDKPFSADKPFSTDKSGVTDAGVKLDKSADGGSGRTIPPPPPPPSGKGPGKASKRGGLPVAVIILVLLCLAMGSALWFQRQQSEKAGREVASRLDGLSTQLEQTRNSARESLALSQAQAGKVASLENALREAQSQYSALEQAWQSFNDTGSDDVLLNDIDRLLTIASQQLRLAGNVNNAIVALETAQSRLARADRPRFASLQESINGDLDRLRGVATVDVAAQSARIDRLAAMVMRAPLLVPDGAVPGGMATGTPLSSGLSPAPVATDPALPADAPWYQHWRAEIASWPSRAGSSLAHELGDLIRVQRVDQPEALILSPEQADQLRATVRQRLLAVQLSLLMRQPAIWQSEMQNVVTTLTRYFDNRAADTVAALALARELEQTRIADPLPDVTNSLNAVAAMRAATAAPREQG